MRKVFKLFVLVLCFSLLTTLLCGCGGGKLDGKWVIEHEDDLSDPNYRYFPSHMELFSDGSGTFYIPYYREASIEWSAENGRLKVSNSIVYDFTYDYSISGKTLTLTFDDVSISYVKE